MANYYFLKLHYDILDDWKVGTLPDSLKWRFIQCLCVAGEEFKSGLLPDINHFAYRIRQEPSALTADMSRLAANGLVELIRLEDGSERWLVTNYAKRQAKIDNATKQRDYRTRQRQAEEKKGNVIVTDSLRQRYDSVTTRNTDIDIDKNRVDKIRVYNAHAENAPPQNVTDAMTAIKQVCKGTLDLLSPSDAFEKAGYEIAELDAVAAVPGFRKWWDDNGHYNGRPALKSLRLEFRNYLDGVDMTPNDKQLDSRKVKHVAGGI